MIADLRARSLPAGADTAALARLGIDGSANLLIDGVVYGGGGGTPSGDWWTDALAAWSPATAADRDASLVNLVDPLTYAAADLTATPTPWESGVGWRMGEGGALSTGISASQVETLIVALTGAVGDLLFGCYQDGAGNPAYRLVGIYQRVVQVAWGGSSAGEADGPKIGSQTSLVVAITRSGLYLDGSLAALHKNPDDQGGGGAPLSLGGIRGLGISLSGAHRVAAAGVWGGTLTAARIAAISEAMAALL